MRKISALDTSLGTYTVNGTVKGERGKRFNVTAKDAIGGAWGHCDNFTFLPE